MQKISSITATATLDGLFTNGSVATGVSPTILDAAWFNTVQKELVAVIEGAGITLDPSNNAQLLAAVKVFLKAQSSGRLLNVQIFKTAGSYNYTPKDGTTTIDVTVVGAGGGGGAVAATNSSQVAAGAGGGGGGTAKSRLNISDLTFPLSITVGKGGRGGTSSTSAQGGTSSSFGSILSATPGAGGANGWAVTYGNTALISNGGGGEAVGGNQFNIKGSGGGRAIILSNGWESGEGGASSISAGGDPIAAGSSIAGTSGRYGSGGGGAYNVQNNAALTGGDGGDGVVMVMEYS